MFPCFFNVYNFISLIKSKIESIYEKVMTKSEMKELATLIYYPEEKLNLIKSEEKDLPLTAVVA